MKGKELNKMSETIGVQEEEFKTRSNIDSSNSNVIQHGEEPGLPLEVVDEEVVEFGRKVKLILNKLPGRNLLSVLENFHSLEINSEKQLLLFVELVYEKAVGEPGQAGNCAKICKEVQMKRVQIAKRGGELVGNFRKLLISMCQKEFEEDILKDLELRFENQNGISFDFCQERQQNFVKRSIGIIEFIGELYMEDMLTPRIMHDCIKQLLLAEMSVYFKQMGKITEQAKFSPRLMRMMKNVMRNFETNQPQN